MDIGKIKEIKDADILDELIEDTGLSQTQTTPPLYRGPSRGLLFNSFYIGSPESARPNFGTGSSKLYEIMDAYLSSDESALMKSIVDHLEYTLACTRFSINNQSAYQAAALAIRDRLIEVWNDTQLQITRLHPKRVYLLSTEFLMGRGFQNCLMNMNIERNMKGALAKLGIDIDEIREQEYEPGLGSGGVGRLAACFLDSMASQNLPGWGYGIRYNYGSFKQEIVNGQQVEVPDYWLKDGNPWEIQRADVHYKVKYYGNVRSEVVNGETKSIWENYDTVVAEAFDNPIPGYQTFNTINLRLFRSIPDKAFNFAKFNEGDYYSILQEKLAAEVITSVLCPCDSSDQGKELRLKQEYFFVSASLQDILRRYKKHTKDFRALSSFVAIQLNDTQSALAIVELLRILIDEENMDILTAWNIATNVFSYTSHTLLQDPAKMWSVSIFGRLLPRHLELVYYVNYLWLEKVRDLYPSDLGKIQRLSLIEESQPKCIRMANLAVLGSHKVNGVSKLHTEAMESKVFKDFYDVEPKRFINISNGVSVRRWVAVANPPLASLYSECLGTSAFCVDYQRVRELLPKVDDLDFRKKWQAVKLKAKRRIVEWLKSHLNIAVSQTFLFDVMIKPVSEHRRQFMFLLYVLHRYLKLKKMRNADREAVAKRVFIIAGKAALDNPIAKSVVRFACAIASLISNDLEISKSIQLVFIPNFSVSIAELLAPGADVSEHISLAGTEASDTSSMKAALNGGLIVGTRNGSNIEISEAIGQENMFLFGLKAEEVDCTRSRVG